MKKMKRFFIVLCSCNLLFASGCSGSEKNASQDSDATTNNSNTFKLSEHTTQGVLNLKKRAVKGKTIENSSFSFTLPDNWVPLKDSEYWYYFEKDGKTTNFAITEEKNFGVMGLDAYVDALLEIYEEKYTLDTLSELTVGDLHGAYIRLIVINNGVLSYIDQYMLVNDGSCVVLTYGSDNSSSLKAAVDAVSILTSIKFK